MRATASSFLIWNGSTASGTAPFGTCSLTPNTCRHQWQRAVISLCGVDRHLGAAAGALVRAQHGCVGRDIARARRDGRAVELIESRRRSRTLPRRAAPCHSWRQNAQMSRSVPGFWRMSVDAHFGQRFRPSFSSLAAVSRATGSGFCSSSRIGGGSVVRIDARVRRAAAARPAGSPDPCNLAGCSRPTCDRPLRGRAPWPSARRSPPA